MVWMQFGPLQKQNFTKEKNPKNQNTTHSRPWPQISLSKIPIPPLL